MTRLFWKEAREQWPFALAALAMPPLLLYNVRIFHKGHEIWPTTHDDLWLLYAFFALWGATRMPPERARGRLTLATLPVARWQVWAVKAWPGFVMALVSASLAIAMGSMGGPFDHPMRQIPWPAAAGAAALGFSAAFAASLAFSLAPSGLLGFITAMVGPGVFFLFHAQSNIAAPLSGYLMMGVAAAILLASLWAMAARMDVARPARWRWAVSAGLACVLGLALWPAASKGDVLDAFTLYFSAVDPGPAVAVSRRMGLVAYDEEGWVRPKSAESGRAQRSTERYSALWVCGLDGRGARRVEETRMPGGAWIDPRAPLHSDVVLIGWLSDGRLLYALTGTRTMKWMLWSPGSNRSREVTTTEVPGSINPLVKSFAAIEPGGTRVAVLRPPAGRLLPLDVLDLWLLDLETGRWTLRLPGGDAGDVDWSRDRIWITLPDNTWSLDPDGGRPRREAQRPPGEEVDR